MRNTQPIGVTRPHDMEATVKSKVASGEYASASEAIRDVLGTLPARDGLTFERASAYAHRTCVGKFRGWPRTTLRRSTAAFDVFGVELQ